MIFIMDNVSHVVIWVVEFSRKGHNIWKFFLSKNQFSQTKLFYFVKGPSGKLSKIAKIWLWKSILLCQISMEPSIFETLYFLRGCPIFEKSPLHQLKNTTIFFENIDLSNFVSLPWKLDNLYYHNASRIRLINQTSEFKTKMLNEGLLFHLVCILELWCN